MGVDDTQPLISHLIELRKRLLNSIIAILVIFLALVYFANDIYQLVSAPLISKMPVGATMIATDVASPFFTPIKLTFMVSVILSVPIILYQVWAFVAPALYKHERRLVVPLLVSSTLLFYIGMAFAYFVVFPLAFGFLTHAAPEGVLVSTDIRSYLDFVMALFMAFGVSFEVPVAIVLLCWMGVTTPEDLRKKRPYVLVGAFVVGMLLTPPDVFSQTLLAIPMYCLFEVGVFFARFYTGKRLTRDDDAAAEAGSRRAQRRVIPPTARQGGWHMGAIMFDIGVNLTSSQFSRDHDEVVARALAAGVNGMLLTGTNLAESQQAQKLASRYSGCWSTAGVHPHDGSSWTPAVAEAIYTLAGEPLVVAIGECGLDFNRNFSTPHEQEVAFSAQLALAAELSMPVFLHCRDAHDRFLTLLKPWLEKLPGAVLHCFTGSRSEVQECLDLGLFIGITGWVCDERRGLELRELLPAIPAERLLLETDAPYLLPRDLKPKPASRRNEPAYLPHILTSVAAWRGEEAQWLEAQTDANVRALFGVDINGV